METDPIDDARRCLLSLRRDSGAWAYGTSTIPAAEPTALAGLALLGTAPDAARAASRWLAAAQSADGSLGATAALPQAGWPTSLACLLWAALGDHPAALGAARRWLLESRGLPSAPTGDGILGHDTTLVGWPWIDGTHSWVEPTAFALLALGAGREFGGPRVAQGLAVIRDRAIPSGGWNMGNPVVFGTALRPQPAPTGLALLALARARGATEPAVGPAIAYLLSVLPHTRASASLAWGSLGLRAWGAEPRDAAAWRREALVPTTARPLDAAALALLLLAEDRDALGFLGIRPRATVGRAS